MKRLVLIGVLILASCTHNLVLTPRTSGGTIGTGVATGNGGGSGKLTINLNGKTYDGTWIYVQGGTIGFGTAFSGTAVASSVGYGVSMSGPGQALLSASDGSRLRCAFQYSDWSDKGMGECTDDAGAIYDLTIGVKSPPQS